MTPQPVQATNEQYTFLTDAFSIFNEQLFENKLTDCIITLTRKPRTNGYLWADIYANKKRQSNHKTIYKSEIALNPDTFLNRSDIAVLSTLLHEMVHLWQFQHGNPGRGRYHNQEWADKMKEVGLFPSNTGEPGGKETGDRMTHYIIEEGNFLPIAKEYTKHTRIKWGSLTIDTKSKPSATRVKFTCPACDTKAYSKPTANLYCMCEEEGHYMQPDK